MNLAALDSTQIPVRGEVKAPFCCIGNEVSDCFLPIMGADCHTLYSLFARRSFSDPKLRHNVRELAQATNLGVATVSRSLEVLEHLRLVKLTRFGGSKDSECQLLDSREVALRLGAEYHRVTLSFSLPPNVTQRLKAEVKALRERRQGKLSPITPIGELQDCGNPSLRVSQRDASVSLVGRQRCSRETQAGTHLLQEEKRIEEVLSPTPSHEQAEQGPKDLPNEVEPAVPLKWARDRFNGVIDDIRAHLLNISKPSNPHLANGYDEWQQFGFNSLAVKAASMRGNEITLLLSASDAAAARRGLDKYRRIWDASLHEWFGDAVEVKLERAAGNQREFPLAERECDRWEANR